MAEFIWPVRVYYEDTDTGGVVYYANYLRFMERARTEWLRELGFEQDQLIAQDGILFAVRSVQLDYLSPARFNDELEVSAKVHNFKGASISFDQLIRRGETDLCRGQVTIACLDADSFEPRKLPKPLLKVLKEIT